MHRVASIAVLALASSAALAEETPADDTATEATEATETLDVDAILANPLGEEDYRKTRDCIWNRQIDKVEILDENLVVFRGRVRGQIWLNKLATRCPGLRRNMVPITNARNGSVCRMSQMGARPRSSLPVELPISCWLGEFEAIDEEQLEALKRAIEVGDKAGKATEQTADG